MLKYAVLLGTEVITEITEELFLSGLVQYTEKHGSVEKAFQELHKDLERAVRRK